MSVVKILFLIAIAGHLICGCCDCLLTYVPGGKKFDYKKMSDNEAMSDTFAKMPLKNINISMLAGCLAMFMIACGYYGIYLWMTEFSNLTVSGCSSKLSKLRSLAISPMTSSLMETSPVLRHTGTVTW